MSNLPFAKAGRSAAMGTDPGRRAVVRRRRRGGLVAVAIGAVVLGGSAHLAAGLGSIIGIDPPAGPPARRARPFA